MSKEILIAYKDPAGNNKYDIVRNITSNNSADLKNAIDDWKNKNAGCEVTHVFNTDNNLIDSQSYLSECTFRLHCGRFGLKPEDFGKKLDNGEIITGLRPRNRKYPIILYNPATGRNMKATPNYIKDHIED